MPLDTYWSGLNALDQNEFAPGAAVGNITAASILPSRIGLPVINQSGGTLTAGTLVYVSGRDSTSGRAKISAAANNVQGARAQWIVQADIANNAQGLVGLQMLLTGQNTNAGNVGDPVYLSTAGGYTLTMPATAGTFVQQVGNILVKSATVGQVNLEVLQNSVPIQISTNEIVAGSITGALQSVNAGARSKDVVLPDTGTVGTIPTTGAVSAFMRTPCTGTLAGVSFWAAGSLAANDTNFVTRTITDLGTNGAGNTALLATTPAGTNTTKATGGQAIPATANSRILLTPTPANTVTAGNILQITATVTGTLGGSVAGCHLGLVFIPTT